MKNKIGQGSKTWGLWCAAAVLLLAGCASVTQQPANTTTPAATAPVEQMQQPQQQPEAFIIEPVQRASMSENRAVVGLLDQAQAETVAGKHEAAGSLLERALRIEPRNPWVWEELAQARLAEGRYEQAISLARKSNSFASGKHRVQAENWQVIGKARVAQGDSLGADQAFKQSIDLAKQSKEEPKH